jgi:hypothetical protein
MLGNESYIIGFWLSQEMKSRSVLLLLTDAVAQLLDLLLLLVALLRILLL